MDRVMKRSSSEPAIVQLADEPKTRVSRPCSRCSVNAQVLGGGALMSLLSKSETSNDRSLLSSARRWS